MDKRRMYQILDVLTLPYCNPDFYHRNQDCIASVREAFYEVSNRNNLGWKKAEQLKKHYHDAENEVKRFVGKQLYVTQIDDYILMLNLFFKEQECNKLFGFFREIDNREYLISVLYLKNLSRIARSLLTFRDGRIAIRMWTNKKDSTGEKDIFSGQDVYNKIEIWNLLSRMMPLDILIAVFLTENELDEEYYLYRQNGMIFLGDNILETLLRRGIAEPWIFAPVYLAIRRQIITKPIRQEKNRYSRINNIGLTYHVGEEFRHILSGFRHIYETISFMGFKAGDRIGHGIALGEDIERWVDRHETIVIPIEEWLENLVWLWGTSISGELNVNIFAEQLKEKIQILASEIYGNDTNLTPDILYEAYLEKFHLLHEKSFEMMKQYCQRDMLEEDGEHFCKYYKGRSNEEHRWTTEKLVCAYFCPVYYRRMQQPIMVHVERENLSLYLKIQEELLRIVAQKGIFVEVNPTSNTAIGENRELFMHHIMNLNNHGLVNEHAHEVMVTINSDDPLIFSTNCENELGYMYHALLSKGYSRERVIEWIDKIRQYGVDSSFVREIRPRNTLLNEIGQILQQIEKIVGVD